MSALFWNLRNTICNGREEIAQLIITDYCLFLFTGLVLCCFDCVCAAWLIDKVHFIGLLPNVYVVMLLLFSREFGSILIRVVLSIWRIGVEYWCSFGCQWHAWNTNMGLNFVPPQGRSYTTLGPRVEYFFFMQYDNLWFYLSSASLSPSL